jgi:hypothetical protein
MDKFLPFLYEKKEEKNKFEQDYLYLDLFQYPTKEKIEDENNHFMIIDILSQD